MPTNNSQFIDGMYEMSFKEWKALHLRGPARPVTRSQPTKSPVVKRAAAGDGKSPFTKLPNEITDEIIEQAVTFPGPVLVNAQYFDHPENVLNKAKAHSLNPQMPLDIREKLPKMGLSHRLDWAMRKLYRENEIAVPLDDFWDIKVSIMNKFPMCGYDGDHKETYRADMAVEEVRRLIVKGGRVQGVAYGPKLLLPFKKLERVVFDMRKPDKGSDGLLSKDTPVYRQWQESGRWSKGGGRRNPLVAKSWIEGKWHDTSEIVGMACDYYEYEVIPEILDELLKTSVSIGMENGEPGIMPGTVFVAVEHADWDDAAKQELLLHQIKRGVNAVLNPPRRRRSWW